MMGNDGCCSGVLFVVAMGERCAHAVFLDVELSLVFEETAPVEKALRRSLVALA